MEHGLPDRELWDGLLQPGFHALSLTEVFDLCVKPFGGSESRPRLMRGLRTMFTLFAKQGPVGEVWLDGSFLTAKPNPNDIDLVLRIPPEFYDGATLQQQFVIDGIRNWLPFGLDVHRTFHWPADSIHASLGLAEYHYWAALFGFDRDGRARGIGVIALGEMDESA
jgi:hypothetical protein